ncbi:MAG: hypothetical protein OXI16_14570 [Chloroflexota bacterium]|nr:hypothetical protein [Chloroflexota bacterium]MDE2688702.1 hypothetical protein [Chloroflexota bacterium]
MTKNTVTFELGGRVEIKDFENGIIAFRRLLSALTPKNERVAWVVEDLQPGSATATLRCDADNPDIPERIVKDYEIIGSSLGHNKMLPSSYNTRVKQAAKAVIALTENIEYVRFETSDSDFVIHGDMYVSDTMLAPFPTVGIGAITGRIQTLSNRAGLRFNLYDTVHDKAVACYLNPKQEEIIREAWGRRAIVSGTVSRDASTGRPIAIRRIIDIEILEDVPSGTYLRARGAIPWQRGYKKPEEIIRQLRDARDT